MLAWAAAGGGAQARGVPAAYRCVAGSARWGPHPASDVRNGNGARLCDRARPRGCHRPRSRVGAAVACRTAQATFDYLLAPPPRMPIIAVRRCSSVSPIIVGAVCAVVVAYPFREHVRTPLGFDHTPSPTRIVYSGLYRRSIMTPRSEPAVVMPIHMTACRRDWPLVSPGLPSARPTQTRTQHACGA
jgi:hypothetical protein